MTSLIRNQFAEIDIPILIFSDHDWLPHHKSSLSILSNAYRSPKTRPIQSIRDQIDMLLDMKFFDRMEDTCHPHALGLLINAFRDQKNGTLYNQNRSIELRDGGVIEYNAERELQLFLQEPSPQFKAKKETGLGDWLTVMDIVWNALKKQLHPGFLTQRKVLGLSVLHRCERLFALPLKPQTLRILFETDQRCSIQERLNECALPQSQIEEDIELLYRLKMCHFIIRKRSNASIAPMNHESCTNEEQGWELLSSLKPQQNIRIQHASPMFRRALLQTQQQLDRQEPTSWIITGLKNHLWQQTYQQLSAHIETDPSWEDLQLYTWLQYLLQPTNDIPRKQLEWLHSEQATSISSICLATQASHDSDFQAAQRYLQQAQRLSQSTQRYKDMKKMLNRRHPIPFRMLHHSL